MQQLSNLDVVILIIVGLSALLAFYRGLIKEVLSIIGWILLTILLIYVLPLLTPIFNQYIESGFMSGIAATVSITVVFFIIWLIFTASISGKIRSLKKLNLIDRLLGLFFGITRAVLFVILSYIAVGWVIPYDDQPSFLTKSKYYNLAGTFAEPIEKMIPQETLNLIKKHSVNNEEKSENKDLPEGNLEQIFENLIQPKIKKEVLTIEAETYETNERNDMDRLMENIAE